MPTGFSNQDLTDALPIATLGYSMNGYFCERVIDNAAWWWWTDVRSEEGGAGF